MIRIILAEDHKVVRSGLRNIIEKDNRFEVVGEASNGQDVIGLINEGLVVDIVLADINMPSMSGLELAQQLNDQAIFAKPKVVMLTMVDHENYIFEAFRAGAHGYLLKDIDAEELLFALSHIYNDNSYICSDLSIRLMHNLDQQNAPGTMAEDVVFSKRELEVLALISDGLTNQEIADKLFTSRRTVEGHRKAMMGKSKVRNSAQLIRFAIKSRMID